jgi:transposase InsO family protein
LLGQCGSREFLARSLPLGYKTLKSDLVYQTYSYTKVQARREIFEYIELYYNRERSHSYLGNLSPSRFEEINLMLQQEIDA